MKEFTKQKEVGSQVSSKKEEVILVSVIKLGSTENKPIVIERKRRPT